MEKVRISVWEPTSKGRKQCTKMYTKFVHKNPAGQEYVSLYGSRWRIRKSAWMNDTFILAGMLDNGKEIIENDY